MAAASADRPTHTRSASVTLGGAGGGADTMSDPGAGAGGGPMFYTQGHAAGRAASQSGMLWGFYLLHFVFTLHNVTMVHTVTVVLSKCVTNAIAKIVQEQ